MLSLEYLQETLLPLESFMTEEGEFPSFGILQEDFDKLGLNWLSDRETFRATDADGDDLLIKRVDHRYFFINYSKHEQFNLRIIII